MLDINFDELVTNKILVIYQQDLDQQNFSNQIFIFVSHCTRQRDRNTNIPFLYLTFITIRKTASLI